MPLEHHLVTAVPIPAQSEITSIYPRSNLADAYSIDLPIGVTADPEELARFIFSHQPRWIEALLSVRDALVAGFGLKTARQLRSMATAGKSRRVGFFRIYSANRTEIVLGEDDRHLDFRVSVLCRDAPSPSVARSLVLSTVVHCHNRLGRLYIFVIAPFHRRVVQSSLRRAAQIGWPAATAP